MRQSKRSVNTFQSLVATPDTVDLTVTLRRAGRSGAVAEARIPARLGASSSLVLGQEGLELVDYHIEVAQHAAAATPNHATTFDGLALWLLPRRTPGGDVVIDVRGGGHLAVGKNSALDLGSPLIRSIASPMFDQLFVDERLTFEGGDGASSAILGATRGSGSGDLQLEISIGG